MIFLNYSENRSYLKHRMTYCPGLEHPEEEYYMPKDLVIGNYIYVYNRKCKIFGCDEFTKNWYKKK